MNEARDKADALYLRNHCCGMTPLTEFQVGQLFGEMRAVHGLHNNRTLICMSHERLRNELRGAEIVIEACEQEIRSLKERLKGGVLT